MDGEAQNEFKNFNDGVSSAMKWATIASIGKLFEVFESSCIYVRSVVGYCFSCCV